MISISVKLDEATIAEARHILRAIPKGWPRAAHRALTRTAKSGRTSLGRLLASRVKSKVGEAKSLIFVHYPSFENLRATLEISKMGHPLIKLSPQQDDVGTSYQPSIGGSRQMIPHAFIATGAKRGRQVWLRSRFRIGRVKMIENKRGRLMEAMYIMKEPDIWRFVKAEDIKQVQSEGEVNLMKNLNHEIEVQLNRWANKSKH
jgi:hypothetical protein